MRKYTNPTIMMVSLMVLVFWLVLLFLDGAFSLRSSFVQESIVSIKTDVVESLVLEDSIITASHAISSVQEMSEMVADVIHQELGNGEIFQDLVVLEYLYTKNKNPELLQPMIEKFLQYYQFDKANAYLTILVTEKGDYFDLNMEPHTVIYARLHDPSISLDRNTSLDEVYSLVREYRTRNLISADDEMFYKGLKSLWMYDYETATAAFHKVVDTRYKDFVSAYDSALANVIKIKDVPSYYRDGLVALTLLKNGYFSLAKRIALRAVTKNSTYILPYQVLAYTNFLTQNWEAAKSYFLKLADFDNSNAFLYKFLIGICYYRNGDYQQSILYLNQVTDSGLQIDVYRYMLLGYIHIDDTVNMLRMFHTILGQSDLQSSDFSLFFDQMFFFPFRSGKPFTLYADNTQLVDLYLGKCSTLWKDSQADVCLYGELGLQLAKQNLSLLGNQIISLTQKYQKSHLYHILGDYYMEIKQYSLAKDAYIKALSISDTLAEQTLLKSKLADSL